MHIDFLLDEIRANAGRNAVVWKDTPFSYAALLERIEKSRRLLASGSVRPGEVVALRGDFTPGCIAFLLALIDNSNIVVPLSRHGREEQGRKMDIAQVEVLARFDDEDAAALDRPARRANHPLYQAIREAGQPGLVLFTSGTSGEPKAAVHAFGRLLEKFRTRRTALRTLNFLLFDHWGGLNTLFHTLSNGGIVLSVHDRSPDAICRFIETYKVELLPTSPTFLNLLLISEDYKRYDLGSLRLITYGTEPMPASTLKLLRTAFPNVRLQQTYGLIELGVLRSKSMSDDSLWVKVGGEGFETRVVDGILQIKADSAMLGYLNAPSPFTDDGFFITGDAVEVDGDYIRILGRRSELINVGGEKVYPAEVEGVIREMGNVRDVVVYGERNTIVGNIVCAKVSLVSSEDRKSLVKRLKTHCGERLEAYKVPVKVVIADDIPVSERFKKIRSDKSR